jgi:hypothetical protein
MGSGRTHFEAIGPLEEFTSEPVRPDKRLDAMRYFQQLDTKHRTDFFALSFFVADDKGQYEVYSEEFIKSCSSIDLSGAQLKALDILALNLHWLLIKNDPRSEMKYNHRTLFQYNESGTVKGPNLEALLETAVSDYSPLRRLIHAISYGETLNKCPMDPDKIKKDPYWSKLYVTTFAISDIIRHLRSRGPGMIKEAVSYVLRSFNVHNSVHGFLCQLGLSTSKKTSTRRQKEQYAEKLKEGLDTLALGQYDYLSALCDNMGFFQGGASSGYLQMILMIFVKHSAEDLVDSGAYLDPSADLSHIADVCEWIKAEDAFLDLVEKDQASYDNVIKVATTDIENLCGVVLAGCAPILALIQKGEFPSRESIEESLLKNECAFVHGVDENLGMALPDSVHVVDVDRLSTSSAQRSHLASNSATAEAYDADFAKTEVLCELVSYIEKISNSVLAKKPFTAIEKKLAQSKQDPLLRSVGPNIGCDGKPAKTLLQSTFAQGVLPTSGDFHVLVNGAKALCRLHSRPVLRAFAMAWRETEGRLNFLLDNPGDPRLLLTEVKGMLRGIWADATKSFVNLKLSGIGPGDSVQVNAVDVWDHMRQRAKEYATVHLVLQIFPLLGILDLLMQAEIRGDAEMVMSVTRLIHPICCADNKTGYIFLNAEKLTRWFAMSDREKALHEKHIMFRKTKHGHFQFHDRCCEEGVFHVRWSKQKKVKGTRKSFIAGVLEEVMLLDDKLDVRSFVKNEAELPDSERGRRVHRLKKMELESYLYSNDLNLWGRGPPRKVPGSPWIKRKEKQPTEGWPTVDPATEAGLLDLTGSYRITPSLLIHLSLGEKRSEQEYCRDRLGDTSVKVSLQSRVDPDPANAEDKQQRKMDGHLTFDLALLGKRSGPLSIAELKADFNNLNSTLADAEQLPKVVAGNKKSWAEAVIQLREKLAGGHKEEWQASRREELEREMGAAVSSVSEDNRKKEIDLGYYNFSETATKQFFSIRKYSFDKPFLDESEEDESETENEDETPPMFNSQMTDMMSTPSTGPFAESFCRHSSRALLHKLKEKHRRDL